jgi:hypothetical protein
MALNLRKLTTGEVKKTANIFGGNTKEENNDLVKIEIPSKDIKDETLKKDVVRSDFKDTPDHDSLRHGRKVHEGTDYSLFLQSTPMFFTRDGHNLWLGDMYKGATAFLICNGPSFGEIITSEFDFKGQKRSGKEILNYPGFVTMGINNGPKSFRPNLWTCVDSPTHFIKSIWLDPKIMKFVPFSFPTRTLFDNEKWQDMKTTVGDCPNIVYYRRNEHFNAEQYLFEDTFNWGNHKDYGGGRSVMLVAVRILFQLGIRRLFLLGADLKMDENTKYHFAQDRSKGSINGNNSTYQLLNERFKELKPIFDKYGFQVFNCNLNSNLHAFPKIKFEQAIEMASSQMPVIETERTEGLYERDAAKKDVTKINRNIVNEAKNFTENEKTIIKKKLDDARKKLNELKDEYSKAPSDELNKKIMEARKVFRELEAEKNKVWGIVKKK